MIKHNVLLEDILKMFIPEYNKVYKKFNPLLGMINKKESIIIILITIIIAVSLSFLKTFDYFLYMLIPVLLVILINVFAKKFIAYYLDSEVEIDVWKVKRYGFRPESHFKKAFPTGAVFPLIFSLLTLGNVVWMASLVFDVKPKVYRAAKRHGLYKFSEMTEDHIGLIASAGIVANIVFAALGYLFGFESFAMLNISFAFFNILPFSDLDGNKIFFGNIVIWSLLAAITLIGLGAALLLV